MELEGWELNTPSRDPTGLCRYISGTGTAGQCHGLDANGTVTHNFQDPSGVSAQTSGAVEHKGTLYVGSFIEDSIAKLTM